jgi:tetratricopeptide (TPR) repeat protein
MKKISGDILLVLGGLCLFGGFGLLFPSFSSPVHPEETDLSGMSAFDRGQYYFNSGDNPSGVYDLALARANYEAAIAADPKGSPIQWYQLGRIDFLEGKFDAALQKFQTQIEYFDDRVPNVYYMIGLTYGYKARAENDTASWEKGEEAFETFITYAPESPWPRVDLAWLYFSQGKFDAMLPLLTEGLQYRPENPWLLNMYGLALLNTGDREGAHEALAKAKAAADALTLEDWGRSYSGNNPATWAQGLAEFRGVIEKNLSLTAP